MLLYELVLIVINDVVDLAVQHLANLDQSLGADCFSLTHLRHGIGRDLCLTTKLHLGHIFIN